MLDENGKAKYADFGASKFILNDDDTCDDTAGTTLFNCPEYFDPKEKTYRGKPADIWALGVTLFALVYN